MNFSNLPYKLGRLWAALASGSYLTATIPDSSTNPAAASAQLGFPPATATPIASGGTPPNIADMNGILQYLSAWANWQQAGGPIPYDSAFQTKISGYPKGAIVASAATAGLWWMSTVDGNTTNPDAAGAGWIRPLLDQSNSFSLPQTVTDTGTGGLIINGSGNPGGANLNLVGNGTSTPNKYIRAISGVLQFINSAYSAVIGTLDDIGNATFTGTITGGAFNTGGSSTAASFTASGNITSTAGAVVGVTVQSNNGNVTAGNGRLRASFGSYGTADYNCATILNDFLYHSFVGQGYQIYPGGLIIQWVNSSSPDNSVHNFPIAFPNACLALVISENAASGATWGSGNPTVHSAVLANAGQFVHWTRTWNGSSWVNPGGGGNSFSLIAVGY